jgi:hypothetical protein
MDDDLMINAICDASFQEFQSRGRRWPHAQLAGACDTILRCISRANLGNVLHVGDAAHDIAREVLNCID